MADYQKLFRDKRLTMNEPHQAEIIKAQLAYLKVSDPIAYDEYSTFYGVGIDAKVMSIDKAQKVLADSKKTVRTATKTTKKS